MKLLLDTHLLLWAGSEPSRIPQATRARIEDPNNELVFSAASIWEVAIKSTLGRSDFQVDARLFRRALIDNGYQELPIDSRHAAAVAGLQGIHKDPFDRILIAQAVTEGITLLTTDPVVANYPGVVQKV